MKRLLSTEFTVGAFALLGLLVIIYMSLEVNDRSTIGGASKTHFAYFESVSGLVKKVAVEVSGIPGGYVDDVSLDNNRARVRIRLRNDIKVHADASLAIRDRGILGDRFIMLNPGSPDQPLLNEGDEIRKTFSQGDIEKLTASLASTAETVKELVESDNPKGALGAVVVNLRDMSSNLKDLVGDNEGRIRKILANLETFSQDLNDITADNKDQIHTVLVALNDVAVSMKDVLGDDGSINRATAKFEKTMDSLDNIVGKVDRGEGTIGKLVNDDATVNNLNDTLEGINQTLGSVNRIQLGIRYRGEFLSSAKELQNLIGFTIAPSPDKYLLFELVDAPKGETKVTDTIVNVNGSAVTTTQTIQTNDSILFTFLLAKRFWDVTFRFGLLRNKGGAGFDYHLFTDKLILSFEAFDFSRVGNRAHLRAYGTLVLYKHLLLTGGVDDLLTKVGGHNAFAGMGIQFTDNDLKSLITAAGSVLR